jgi:hypothetical protein
VRNLVTDKHIEHVFAHVLPERKTEFTLFNIEVSGFIVALLNRDILVGEKTGKD